MSSNPGISQKPLSRKKGIGGDVDSEVVDTQMATQLGGGKIPLRATYSNIKSLEQPTDLRERFREMCGRVRVGRYLLRRCASVFLGGGGGGGWGSGAGNKNAGVREQREILLGNIKSRRRES